MRGDILSCTGKKGKTWVFGEENEKYSKAFQRAQGRKEPKTEKYGQRY